MFISNFKSKVWRPWGRAQLCTLAVSLGLNATWRIPRDAFKFGGLSYGLLLTVALVTVALPAVLLQLSVGQLSQQNPVGVWKAVPFFKGIGFIRLLIAYVSAVCVMAYLAMSATFFLYTLNNNIPFWECTELVETEGQESVLIYYNASTCFNETFFAPIQENPEYYVAASMVVIFLWLLFPFVLYNPAKSMKFIFYIFGPIVLLMWLVIIGNVGNSTGLKWFSKTDDWKHFLRPNIWNKAIAQALSIVQVAGGFLISSGSTIYSSSDVEWLTLSAVGTGFLSIWFGLILWFSLGIPEPEESVFVILAHTYDLTVENNLSSVWPLLIFATLFLSGVITMVCLLYPIYDWLCYVGNQRWRYIAVFISVIGCGIVIGGMAEQSIFVLFEDIIIPFLVNVTTIAEICAFVFVYGWKVLLHDIDFLIGREVLGFWVWGLCAAPGIILPFLIWWYTKKFVKEIEWIEPPWESSGLAASSVAVFVIIVVVAIFSVARQVQYDIIGKFKASLKPSRHWGPKDPIAHYYWLIRRDEVDPHAPRSRYHRRNLGQFSGTQSILSNSKSEDVFNSKPKECKRRSNSDDWLYKYRRQYLAEMFNSQYNQRKRSKSLDWYNAELSSNKNDINLIGKSSTTKRDSFILVEKNE